MDTLRDALRTAAQAEMASDPAHDMAHLDRVWANAQSIAQNEGHANLRVLVAAAYLHDLVNLPKNSPKRTQASRMAAEQAAPILVRLGYAPDEITQAQHAIAAHSYSAGLPVETREAAILRDADRLDAIGAIGIARTFSIAGQMGTPLYDPSDPFAVDRPLDDTQHAIDHWKVKLLGLGDGFLTAAGTAEAEKRMAVMNAFLDQFASEICADLPDEWRA